MLCVDRFWCLCYYCARVLGFELGLELGLVQRLVPLTAVLFLVLLVLAPLLLSPLAPAVSFDYAACPCARRCAACPCPFAACTCVYCAFACSTCAYLIMPLVLGPVAVCLCRLNLCLLCYVFPPWSYNNKCRQELCFLFPFRLATAFCYRTYSSSCSFSCSTCGCHI